jgi:hypothetical protein
MLWPTRSIEPMPRSVRYRIRGGEPAGGVKIRCRARRTSSTRHRSRPSACCPEHGEFDRRASFTEHAPLIRGGDDQAGELAVVLVLQVHKRDRCEPTRFDEVAEERVAGRRIALRGWPQRVYAGRVRAPLSDRRPPSGANSYRVIVKLDPLWPKLRRYISGMGARLRSAADAPTGTNAASRQAGPRQQTRRSSCASGATITLATETVDGRAGVVSVEPASNLAAV